MYLILITINHVGTSNENQQMEPKYVLVCLQLISWL